MDTKNIKDTNYKKIFDNNISNNIELCGMDICNLPINIIKYVYYKCL